MVQFVKFLERCLIGTMNLRASSLKHAKRVISSILIVTFTFSNASAFDQGSLAPPPQREPSYLSSRPLLNTTDLRDSFIHSLSDHSSFAPIPELAAKSELRFCEAREVIRRYREIVVDTRKSVKDFLDNELPKLVSEDMDRKMFRALYEKILLERNPGLSLKEILAKKDYPKEELQAIADEARKRIENLVVVNNEFSDALMEEVAKEFPEEFAEFVEEQEGKRDEMLKDAAHMISHDVVEDGIVGELILDLINEKGEPEKPLSEALQFIARYLKNTKGWFLYKNGITKEKLAEILSRTSLAAKLQALLKAANDAFAIPPQKEEKNDTALPAKSTSLPASQIIRNQQRHGRSEGGNAAPRSELRAKSDKDLMRDGLEASLAPIYVQVLAEMLKKSAEEVRRGVDNRTLTIPDEIADQAMVEAQRRFRERLNEKPEADESKKPQLPPFFEDLTEKAEQKKLRRIYYRDQIVSEIASRLAKNKNASVLLVGEPGTGKTAIAQLLAQKMFDRKLGVERVDGGRLLRLKVEVFQAIAGATIDTFSAAFLAFLEEAKKPNTYVFIDEFQKLAPDYNLPGATDSFYRSLLEPLESGEVRIVAATTKKHFERSIKPHEDVMERFGGLEGYIKVNPLTPEQSKSALKKIRGSIEDHYNEPRPSSEHIHITDDAIYAAVDLTEEVMPWKVLVRKAEEALDTAASIVSNRASSTRAAIESLKENLTTAINELQQAHWEKREDAIQAGNKTVSEMAAQLIEKLERIHQGFSYAVGKEDVREALLQTGVPKHLLDDSPARIFETLSGDIKAAIRGQDEMIESIVDGIAVRFDQKPRGAPLGTFWIDGASGTGKTELAKQLAKLLMNTTIKDGTEQPQLIKINGGEYKQPHMVMKLLGAPPSYVGYKGGGGELYQKVKSNPYSVILIDEADKVDPSFFDTFLGIIDGGGATSPDGTYVDFTQTITVVRLL